MKTLKQKKIVSLLMYILEISIKNYKYKVILILIDLYTLSVFNNNNKLLYLIFVYYITM